MLICGIAHAERFDDGSALLDYLEYLSQLVPHCTETSVVQDNEETRRGFRYEQMIEQYLPKAIHDDLFEVCYQPIYSLKRESYESIEALSRLHHPSLGPVSPDVFIRIAEHNDMIAYVDLLQLRRVCRFLQANPSLRKRIRSVKLNLSPIELMKAGHAQALIRVIREHELPTSLFQFEVTETVATEYSENLEEAVQAFVDAGIGLCLDDFGSGFANLNTVLRLPFSTIKLDRSLLKGVSEDEPHRFLLQEYFGHAAQPRIRCCGGGARDGGRAGAGAPVGRGSDTGILLLQTDRGQGADRAAERRAARELTREGDTWRGTPVMPAFRACFLEMPQ